MRADEYESRDDENPFFTDPPAAAPVEESSLSIGEQRRLKDELRRMQDENRALKKRLAAGADLEAQPLLAAPAPAPLTDHAEGPLAAALADDARACASLSAAAARYGAPGSGVTALHVAAGNGSGRALRALLARGDASALLEARDAGGRTPLYHAAEHGRLDGVVCLCAAGAGSAADGSGKTPAHVAAARGDADALSVMGFYGLDLNGVDGSGATPLEAAASRDAVDAVEQLVLAERVPVRDAEALAAAREGRSFWSARCARANAGYGDGAPVLACPTVPREPRCAWPISEQGPLNASLCPRRWAIATAVLAALYATFVTSSGASLGTVEALALVALVSTAAGSYCYYVAATADPGLLRDEATARKAYAAALAALARDGDAARRSPVVLHHRAKLAGPPRSKFDASTRGVVLDFDHYCVFLRRPVGRGNYGAFLGVVAFAFVACAALVVAGSLAAAEKHADRESATWDVLVAVYFGCFALLWGQLLLLHAYLALRKVTTFEALALQGHHARAAYLDAVEPGLHWADAPGTCYARARGREDALPDLAAAFAAKAAPDGAGAATSAPGAEGRDREFTI